ncbi:uncharacterized protein LOC121418730 [Lytechinus variegatus]|uniref:uncharacterized protein LOC121418730 n=1 Tax=Lytechinus variegatus TaxID=7654 RepID=UPI001BB24A15|nr:uncharacterized protein LOC121418730 [Lytechinus variegatus]
MLKYINHLQTAIVLLVVVTSAKEFISKEEKGRNVELQSFTINSPESIGVIFKSEGLLFNISSDIQDEEPKVLSKLQKAREGTAGNVVSVISVVDLEDRMGKNGQPFILSKLEIPKKFLYQRKIPDMEARITSAAKDMVLASQAFSTSTGIALSDLVKLYDAMIGYLVPISDVQNKFNQVRAAFIYHGSIARTALRLSKGVPSEGACPAHQAYDFQGLFACQQEYSHHAKKVLSSKILDCKDVECVKKIHWYLAHLLSEDGLDLEETIELVEDVLGLGLGNNSKLAEEVARLIACGNISCFEPGCNSWIYTDGWFIFGSDWGCCGDYRGCCFLATETCLVHDAICTCCSFPTFCLDPFCKPDPWCNNVTTTVPPPFP